MSRVQRKSVFGASDQVRHKLGCTAPEDGLRLETLDLGSKGIVLSFTQNIKGLGLMVSEKKIFFTCFLIISLWRPMTPGLWPTWTPGA